MEMWASERSAGCFVHRSRLSALETVLILSYNQRCLEPVCWRGPAVVHVW